MLQLSVVHWDADATFEKMSDLTMNIHRQFPWVNMIVYHELIVPALVQFCVFDIPDVGRFGLCICYDMWFPEVSRTLAWMGAEIIIQPTLTPTSDRPLELVMARANALFNQCYFFSINGVGDWGGGRSTIIDPDGRILQEVRTNQTFMTELIDLDHTTRTREYRTLRLGQTLKQLRDSGHKFPIYGGNEIAHGSFDQLGELKFHQNKGLPLK